MISGQLACRMTYILAVFQLVGKLGAVKTLEGKLLMGLGWSVTGVTTE